jgi:alkaline phosphatase D
MKLRYLIFSIVLFFSSSTLFGDNANRTLHVIGFGSCIDQNRPKPILDTIIRHKPDLFIFLGDNIYADTFNMDLMKSKYEKLGKSQSFQNILKTCPVIATWDDHDYGVNDAGADYPRKRESQELFLDFWGEPEDSPRRKSAGIYEAYYYGPEDRKVQIILLDTRFFRGPLYKNKGDRAKMIGPYRLNENREDSILGETQWRWLETQLGEKARIRIIASSIQVVAEFNGWEGWGNFPHEKERLFDLLSETRANGVIFISGDRHYAELSVYQREGFYPLFDLTSSALNRSNTRSPSPNMYRVSPSYHDDNFGLLQIRWDEPDPSLSLSILDLEGNVRIYREISLSTLNTF